MYLLLEAGFGSQLGKVDREQIASMKFDGIRQDIPVGAPEDVIAGLVKNAQKNFSHNVFIVGGWAHWYDLGFVHDRTIEHSPAEVERDALIVCRLARPTDYIEVGNEWNITPQYRDDPEKYIETVARVRLAINHPMLAGSVSGLDDGGLSAFRKVFPLLHPQIIVSFHPYRQTHEPWVDGRRMTEVANEIKSYNRRFAVSECGWHTNEMSEAKAFPRCLQKRYWSWTDEQVGYFFRWEIGFWGLAGAELYTWYQHRDGGGETFGVVDASGRVKPVGGGRCDPLFVSETTTPLSPTS